MHYTPFLDAFFEQIRNIGLDISGLPLDHIAYQASTKEDYAQRLPQFSELGELVSEEIIGGRRVAVVKLDEPFTYNGYSISALELIEPKEGQQCESAFQHAEFVVNQPFEKYIEQYPDINWDTSSMGRGEFSHLKLHFENGLTLKFLQRPILELFEEKKKWPSKEFWIPKQFQIKNISEIPLEDKLSFVNTFSLFWAISLMFADWAIDELVSQTRSHKAEQLRLAMEW